MLPPLQKVVGVLFTIDIFDDGRVFTVTVTDALPVHDVLLVQLAVYVAASLTTIEAVVSLIGTEFFVQTYGAEPPLAVSVAELPEQMAVDPAGLMLITGIELMVTDTGLLVLTHPFESVPFNV